ncbi:MAG: valine--tRNA ligase [Deltaproteobacteria bacterium]|nr:valine--tRNA ligase [Deltaproteobacteria bacterium]
MEPIAKGYSHREVEARWYDGWVDAGYFHAEAQSDKDPYCIVIPPPNVTGHLHIGHALTLTIQDVLIRYKRMCGFNTLWLPGTDHAGIATQMVVERDLAAKGVSRFDLGRRKFLDEVWRWKDAAHAHIVKQMKALSISVDWDRERFTLDEGLSRAVREVFVRLYEEGLIYRAQKMVNWSPAIRTVLSDLEVEEKELESHLWHIAYPVEGTDVRLVVATTRPETMLGDTAVAVHPEDERYRHLIGKQVKLPLTDRLIPVIGDAEAVDPEFGTGALKITPGHDFTDFEVGRRHGLPVISILTEDAHLNDEVPPKYRGLERFEAREVVVRDLEEQGFLVSIEDYKHVVGHCQRSGVVVEPTVSLQWFVKAKTLAGPALDAVRNGDTVFIPKTWEKTYFNWMENIRDWCISRQLWWGHQIPVWYCRSPGCEGIYVGVEDPDESTKCPACGAADWKQDEDVLDTWFSSALWPFSTLGWPDETRELKTFYPNTVMETGFDIIFFWVARMMMMGIHFMGEVPFGTVYFHAMVRDEAGQKMSKTKGNVIDPLELVDEVGADALRFTLATLTAQGRDVKLSVDRIQGYREFVNKLWNAARFVFMNLDDVEGPLTLDGLKPAPADRWILTRLDDMVAAVRGALDGFRFNEGASVLYQFVWHRFCDWYLELAKGALAEGGPRRRTAQTVLVTSLDGILRALHPFMPNVTEELWQRLKPFLAGRPDSIVVDAYPMTGDVPRFDEDARAMDEVLDLISAVRGVRSQVQVPPSEQVGVLVRPGGPEVAAHLDMHREDIRRLGRVDGFVIDADAQRPDGAALAVLPFAECYVEIGAERIEAEIARLNKAIAKARKGLEGVERKLENPKFIDRAPEQVVQKERLKAAELKDGIQRLDEAVRSLGG